MDITAYWDKTQREGGCCIEGCAARDDVLVFTLGRAKLRVCVLHHAQLMFALQHAGQPRYGAAPDRSVFEAIHEAAKGEVP